MSGQNKRVELTPDARRDLAVISRYSERRWGKEQRKSYIRQLTTMMERLANFPELGESRDHLQPGMRARIVAEHVIYYRVDGNVLTVLHILHQSMDAAAQLKS